MYDISLFFFPKEDGSYELGLNGHKIDPKKLRLAKESLEDFLKNLTPEYMDEYNRSVDDYWNTQFSMERQEARKKKENRGHIYLVRSESLYKIGRTKNVTKRFRSYSTENPYDTELVAHIEVEDCHSHERRLHEKYKKYRERGEWFRFPDDILGEVKSLQI